MAERYLIPLSDPVLPVPPLASLAPESDPSLIFYERLT